MIMNCWELLSAATFGWTLPRIARYCHICWTLLRCWAMSCGWVFYSYFSSMNFANLWHFERLQRIWHNSDDSDHGRFPEKLCHEGQIHHSFYVELCRKRNIPMVANLAGLERFEKGFKQCKLIVIDFLYLFVNVPSLLDKWLQQQRGSKTSWDSLLAWCLSHWTKWKLLLPRERKKASYDRRGRERRRATERNSGAQNTDFYDFYDQKAYLGSISSK